jgi:hypothetical protein
MSQVLQTSGNYKIKSTLGGTITLDTGPSVGTVLITGNLVVKGDASDIEVSQLRVEDNIITLNKGETGNGVSLRYSGIEIDRGTVDKATFVFDETENSWIIAKGQNGSYSFNDSALKLRTVTFVDDTPNALPINLQGFGTPGGAVFRITGFPDYETYVVNDDDVPNKKYVDDRIVNNPTFQIVRQDSRVTVQDIQDPDDPFLTESRIVNVVDNNRVLTVYNNRVEIQNLEFFSNVIRSSDTNENIRLVTNGTGKVELDYAVQYNHVGGTPAMVEDATLLYGNTPGAEGGSGIYFVNKQVTGETVSGELVSKAKALTFSLIF